MKWTIEQIVTFFLSSKIFCLSLRWIEYEEGPSIICYLCCYCTLFPRTLIDFLLFSLPSFLTSFFLLLSPPAWQSIIGQFANCIFGEIENKENKSKIRTIFQKGKVNNQSEINCEKNFEKTIVKILKKKSKKKKSRKNAKMAWISTYIRKKKKLRKCCLNTKIRKKLQFFSKLWKKRSKEKRKMWKW